VAGLESHSQIWLSQRVSLLKYKNSFRGGTLSFSQCPQFPAGLPDGIFSNQKKLGNFLRALNWKIFLWSFGIGICITDIWCILRPFGNLCSGNLVYFPRIWAYCVKKIWQPWFPDLSRALRWGAAFPLLLASGLQCLPSVLAVSADCFKWYILHSSNLPRIRGRV
jgi:hypothetical protein